MESVFQDTAAAGAGTTKELDTNKNKARSGLGVAFVTPAGPSSSTAGFGQGTRRSASEGEVRGEMAATGDARHHPSALRNRDFISAELVKWIGQGQGQAQEHTDGDGVNQILEIASGTGCHAEAFSKVLPAWSFQPTEYDESRIPDILATIEEGQYSNICPPLVLDVCSDPSKWPRPARGEGAGEGSPRRLWDAVICSNMIHVSPKECTGGLLKGASAGLKSGGHLFIYGPFALNGLLIPDSNKSFDESLKARSGGSWGIRDVAWVASLADEQGLELKAMTLMPANNFFVVFTKVAPTPASSADATKPAGDGAAREADRVADRVAAVVMAAREALEASVAAK
eukprot:g8986.t1